MTDSVVSDALVFPHDEGLPNISDGDETWDSAGFLMLLALAADGGSFIRSDTEMTFTGHDGANDQVDVAAGVAFLDLTGEAVSVQSTRGGSTPPAYDTALPSLPSVAVVLPTNKTNLTVTASTLNDFWLAYDTDGTGPGAAGSVYIRHGSGLSAPSHPSVKIGQANPDNAGTDVLDNRFGSPTLGQPTFDRGFVDGAGTTHTGEVADLSDIAVDSVFGRTGAVTAQSGDYTHSQITGQTASDHHAKYTDSDAESAINADADHGSTAPHNYFSGAHGDLTGVTASQHHAKYTDAEAQNAALIHNGNFAPGF